MKILMALIFLTAGAVYADDIYFISPMKGHSAENGMLKIEIEPPRTDTSVRVWIEEDFGRERTVWRGTLTKAGGYMTEVDVSKFTKGKYEVKAVYYMGREDYDGDVTFWVD